MLKPLLMFVFTASASAALADPILLAAASTRNALDAGIAESGIAAVASYGSSGTLARQIEQGAPADLFVSANPKWMEHLVSLGLIEESAVRVLMSNTLVLIAPEDSAGAFDPASLAQILSGENFAMGDPQTAPVGSYGQAALTALGLWDTVAPHLVPTRNTTATVAAVAQGEAALGLVYGSDALGQPSVSVVWTFPADSHPPIRYLIAPLSQGDDPEAAAALLGYLTGPESRHILAEHGFVPLAEGS